MRVEWIITQHVCSKMDNPHSKKITLMGQCTYKIKTKNTVNEMDPDLSRINQFNLVRLLEARVKVIEEEVKDFAQKSS